MYEESKKAYKKIVNLLNKHKEIINLDIDSIKGASEHHLLGLKLNEIYNFDIDPKRVSSIDYIDLGEHECLALYDNVRRNISWPDGGRQPKNEMLYRIWFSTGAFIFGGDYPTDFFRRFWMDLLKLDPDYIDSHNWSIYFSLEKAGDARRRFKLLYDKYKKDNREDIRLRQIKKLEEDILKLKQQ